MRITKKAISLILAVMMIASLFVAVPMSASAVTQNDINVLLRQMDELAMEREQQDDYEAADALYMSSRVLEHQFRESENYATDPNVERAYNIASAVYNHFNGTGSVDVTSVSATEVDKLDEALMDLAYDYMMSDDYYNFRVLSSAEDILQEAYHAADGNSEDPDLLSAYSLVSFILAQYTGTTGSYTVTWNNWDGSVLETDTNVEKDATPEYNGATPTKASDSDKHYTFSGWSNGTTTYGLNDTLPAVSGDVTYTAQFTEAAHTFNTNPTFNWTQTDAPTGDWDCNKLTLSCSCGATQDTDVYGFSFGGGATSSAVKCTANADGSYTYSVSKKVGSTTYQDSKTVDANGVAYTANQLKAAAKLGGEWELGNDIAEVTGVSCADGFVLDGNNKTLSAHTFVKTSPMFKSANKTAEYTLKNLTIDGVAGETQSQPAISSATTSTGQTNVINLVGVTIKNYDFDAANNGAVLAFGHAEVNLTNCKIDTDSQNDVWGGAASTVNVSGGEVGTVYLNGGTSTADLTNGAKVDTIKTATGSTVTADSADMINPPAGYIVQDNGNGTYSIVVDPDPLALAPIIGFQKKAATGNLTGNNIDTQGVRIITKIEDVDLTQFDEYGYVVAKVSGKQLATANFNNLKAYGGNGEKTIKCNGTVNTIDGYGTPYVTLAVNGMNDGDQVAARFYAIKDGVTYYSNYVSTARYNGIIATY